MLETVEPVCQTSAIMRAATSPRYQYSRAAQYIRIIVFIRVYFSEYSYVIYDIAIVACTVLSRRDCRTMHDALQYK